MNVIKGVKTVNHSGHCVDVTLDQLASIPTPAATPTWRPIPHIEVIRAIEKAVTDNKWKFTDKDDPFHVVASLNGTKMFGTTGISVPGVLEKGEEFELQLGFRQSHNKTIGVHLAIGQRVFVCSNMAFNGDLVLRREHTGKIDIYAVIAEGLQQFPVAAKAMASRMDALRDAEVRDVYRGIDMIAASVEVGAIPLDRFLPARDHYRKAWDGEAKDILHHKTLFGVYNAITFEWKSMAVSGMNDRSVALNSMVAGLLKG